MKTDQQLSNAITDLVHLCQTLNNRHVAGLNITPTMWKALRERMNTVTNLAEEVTAELGAGRAMTLRDDSARAAGFNLDNQAKGLCVKCGRPALEHCQTEDGRREVAISGVCEECFDALFGPGDYPDDDDGLKEALAEDGDDDDATSA